MAKVDQRSMKLKKENLKSFVISHLDNISRALLEGDKRPTFLAFLEKTNNRQGIYVLYDKAGRIYYSGKASDLRRRLDQHLKDVHAQDWQSMTLFFLSKAANISEIEGLLVASAKPKGNKQKPRIGKDMRSELAGFLKEDARLQIDKMVYPKSRKKIKDKLSTRITVNKLKAISQSKLAEVLGVTPGRVSQIVNEDKKNLLALRDYIQEGGHRDKVLSLVERLSK